MVILKGELKRFCKGNGNSNLTEIQETYKDAGDKVRPLDKITNNNLKLKSNNAFFKEAVEVEDWTPFDDEISNSIEDNAQVKSKAYIIQVAKNIYRDEILNGNEDALDMAEEWIEIKGMKMNNIIKTDIIKNSFRDAYKL